MLFHRLTIALVFLATVCKLCSASCFGPDSACPYHNHQGFQTYGIGAQCLQPDEHLNGEPRQPTGREMYAACNLWNCDCEPCYGCGVGRFAEGLPNCNNIARGGNCNGEPGVECGNSNTEKCYKQGVANLPAAIHLGNDSCPHQTSTELATWFKKVDLKELEKKLTAAICKKGGHVGVNFVKDIIALTNKGGREAMSCEDYLLYKQEIKIKTYKGSGKVPNPPCAISTSGKMILAKTRSFYAQILKEFA